jgi:electron transport complex protein RnfC
MISEYKEYLSPIKVYIPLTDTEYKIANVHVEIGDKVLEGQKLADKFSGKLKRAVISSVSGTVAAFVEKVDRYGKIVDHVVVENNRKGESVEVAIYKEEVTSSQVRNRLAEFGIDNVSIDGLSSNIDFAKQVNQIIVSGVFVNEPFVTTDYEFLAENAEAISEGIKLLGIAANTPNLTIVVDKNMATDVLNEVGKAIIDKNINLELADTKRLNGWENKLVSKFIEGEVKQNVLENGVLFTSVGAAKMIYDAVRLGQAPVNRQLALTGDGLKSNCIYNVKVGTLLSDLVEDLGGYNDVELMEVHVGSFLTGIQVATDDFAITKNVESVRVAEYRSVAEDVCIKCGDCNDVCPAGILPQNIMDAELRSVNARIVDLETALCTECGLCTYVCPSKINVMEWVRRAKRRVG